MEGSAMVEMFEQEEPTNSWIVTFADMMTLILVFFILLYTLADFEDEAYRAEIAKINVIDGEGREISVLDYAERQGRDPEPLQAVENMLGLNPSEQIIEPVKPKIYQEMRSMIDYTDLDEGVALDIDGNRIHLTIDGRFLFDSGKAELRDQAKIIFNNLAQLFRENPDFKIDILGHTDDLAINTAQFPSNWELSAVRATTVLRYFIDQGLDPLRMSATGYADSLPMVPNNSAENRELNRRVEFVLEKETEE